MNLDRLITTDISANIVAALLRRRWSLKRIADTIDAPATFVAGIREKRHVLTLRDIEALAKRTGETAPLMIANAIGNVPDAMLPLVESTRKVLRASAKLQTSLKKNSKRRSRTKAA